MALYKGWIDDCIWTTGGNPMRVQIHRLFPPFGVLHTSHHKVGGRAGGVSARGGLSDLPRAAHLPFLAPRLRSLVSSSLRSLRPAASHRSLLSPPTTTTKPWPVGAVRGGGSLSRATASKTLPARSALHLDRAGGRGRAAAARLVVVQVRRLCPISSRGVRALSALLMCVCLLCVAVDVLCRRGLGACGRLCLRF